MAEPAYRDGRSVVQKGALSSPASCGEDHRASCTLGRPKVYASLGLHLALP